MIFKNLDKWAEKNNISTDSQSDRSKLGRVINKIPPPLNVQQSPPMMYRAQVVGRCNLQFAGDDDNLERWKKEWILPQQKENHQPSYQYHYEPLDSNHPNHLIHSIKLTFPYRVLSNSGQDSILRPVLTAHGIPFIPGSSVKGIFKRLIKSKSEDSADKELISEYCGTEETPGILRFHGAYPIGDWSKQMVDIIHPQQSKQVIGDRSREINMTGRPQQRPQQVRNNESTSAYSLISFYQPEFVFEFSSLDSHIDWQNVERILREALTSGLGGKTSTGYGFSGKPNYSNPDLELYQEALHVSFKGRGVASTLLNRQPEFRPNMFKAALRGHMMRLFSGVCGAEDIVTQNVNSLLGDTDREGSIKLFWESTSNPYFEYTNPKTYTTEGILHISSDSRANLVDISFIDKVLQFAYVMGGFGKSWRRIAHEKFYPKYLEQPRNGRRKPDIGCHWELKSEWVNFRDPLNVNSEDTLKSFLGDLHRICLDRLGSRPPAPIVDWREAWHPDRVAVYSQVVDRSQAIILFHQEPFKYTPAIGGRKREGQPTSVSHVWHRMLPIKNNQYLEIISVFRQTHENWNHQTEGDMRDRFIQELLDRGFKLVWGNQRNI
jgi:CRISPR-associated protein Cmr6